MPYWTSDLLLHGWAVKQRFVSLLSLGKKDKGKGNPQGNKWLSQKRLLLHTPAFVSFNNGENVLLHAVPHSQPLNNIFQKLHRQHPPLRLHINASYFLNALFFFWDEWQDLHPRYSCAKILPQRGNSSHLHFSEPYNYFSVHSAVQNQILNRANWIEFLDRHAHVGSLKFLNSSLLWWFQVALLAPCSPIRWMRKHSEIQQFQQTGKIEESGFSSWEEAVSKMGITRNSLILKLLTVISH